MTTEDTRSEIVAALRGTSEHIRRITALADDTTRDAVDRYVCAVVEAQIGLRQKLEDIRR